MDPVPFNPNEAPPPGAFLFGGMPPPPPLPGQWPPAAAFTQAEHGKDDELLVPFPYDDVYRAYIQWRVDMAHNETYDATNSQKLYWNAYNEFARFWNRTHMPINKTPFHGDKE